MPNNYCTAQQAADLTGGFGQITVSTIKQDWLDWVDSEIEQYTGQGYKGATRTVALIGDGTSILRIPSKGATITSITENGQLLDTSQYNLEPSQRFIERLNTSYTYSSFLYYQRTGCWYRDYRYVITYVEPGDSTTSPAPAPKNWNLAAAESVSTIALFVAKRKSFGLALTDSDAGSAGKVSTASSNSFPASLVEEVRRTIQLAIRKYGI